MKSVESSKLTTLAQERLFFRADSTTPMGTGHIMRCLALAQAWQDHGRKVTFLSHCESEFLRQRILKEGFEFIPIEKPHPDPDDLDFTLDMLSAIKHQTPATILWLVLDGYHFTTDFQKAIRENGHRLLIIDDMAHLSHYHADILLNQNIHASTLRYSCDRDTVKLFGCEYILLRREFLKHKDWKREIPQKANKILVTMGGADPDNVTLKVIRALNSLNVIDLEVKIVVGPSNPNIINLQKELAQSSLNFEILMSVKNMSHLMTWADLSISAAGSTCWELAFMGLPSLFITVADNQMGIAEALQQAGAGIHLGWYDEIMFNSIVETLQKILYNNERREDISESGYKLVDGRGGKRILRPMLVNEMQIQHVKEGNCKLLWKWVNDPQTRSASFHSNPITWEQHSQWFKKKLKSSDCIIYLITINQNNPFGQVRFDIKKNNAIISLSITTKFRGIGMSSEMIKQACVQFFRENETQAIQALVKEENMISISAFKKAGFVEIDRIKHLSFPTLIMECKKIKLLNNGRNNNLQ